MGSIMNIRSLLLRGRKNAKVGLFFLATASILPLGAFAADDIGDVDSLLNLSMNDLLKKNVIQSEVNKEEFSSSKNLTRAIESPSAVTTITSEDIARSGATSIPDALRMVPGVQVARAGANDWAVSVRGFNNPFANKLLVLVDGRSIYTPIFSGVYWDTVNVPMENIARIEVVRGPGGTMWGANAVNGVINIITKKAKSTNGTLVSTTYGNSEFKETVRQGGKVNKDTDYRVYAETQERSGADTFVTRSIMPDDASENHQAGFRVDTKHDEKTDVTVQGDAFYTEKNQYMFLPNLKAPFTNKYANRDEDDKGGNIMYKLGRRFDDGSNLRFQSYLMTDARNQEAVDVKYTTFDLDLQYDFKVGERHNLNVGAGYRYITDSVEAKIDAFTPATQKQAILSSFVQDKIRLFADRLYLTIGSKFSYNDYTFFEVQPSARLAWYPTYNQTVWTSVSQAVRTPDRLSASIGSNGTGSPAIAINPAGTITLLGNAGVQSEKLTAYEAGYRIQPNKDLSFDTSVFYNRYRDLIVSEYISKVPPILKLGIDNNPEGFTYGGELSSSWKAAKWLDVNVGASCIDIQIDPGSYVSVINSSQTTPQTQFFGRFNWHLPYDVEVTNSLYQNSKMHVTSGTDVYYINAYTKFDTKVAWTPKKGVELSLAGQDLLDDKHLEFSPFLFRVPEEIGRSYYANVKLTF